MQEILLVTRISADQRIAEAVQNQPHRGQRKHGHRQVHRVLVVDVDEQLNGLHQNGEAECGQKDADNEHGQDVDARPAECVAQRSLAIVGGRRIVDLDEFVVVEGFADGEL